MRFEPKQFHPTRGRMAVFAIGAGISSAHAKRIKSGYPVPLVDLRTVDEGRTA